MKRTRWIALGGLASIALSASLAAIEQPVSVRASLSPKTFDLRYRLTKGARFSVANIAQYENYRDVDGRLEKNRAMFAGMVLDYRVLSVDQGDGASVEVTYRRRYRTNEDAAGVATPIDFTNLVGGRFTYRLAPRGAISQMAGFDTLNVRLADGREWSRDQLKAEIEHLFPTLPDHPVRIGDTWRSTVAEGPDIDTLDYRLLGEAEVNGLACVRFVARYWTDSDHTQKQDGRTFTIKGRTIGNDVYYFAYKEGMLVSRVSTGQTNIEVSEAGQPTRRTHTEEMYETNVRLR